MSLTPVAGLNSLLDQAWRLEGFGPPFAFSAFFSPEDTLLCVCAADSARELLAAPGGGGASQAGVQFAELTSGSGLVGLYLLGRDQNATLLGLDIDYEATEVAERNALTLGLGARARFVPADLWSPETVRLLTAERPRLVICNPPYVPEPPEMRMQIEAGAGPHGTAHVIRALELTRMVRPDALALSWCSLAHPGGIVAAAEASGYELDILHVTAIADGEYSGSVHSYLRDLPDCFINEQSETLKAIAPDGSARFAYLLLAGAFRRGSPLRYGLESLDAVTSHPEPRESPSDAVQKLCVDFARDGISTLASTRAPFKLHCSVLDRWDELQLRVMLHGQIPRSATSLA